MRAILALATLLGCAGVGEVDTAQHICGLGNPSVDAAVFGALTRTSWYDAPRCAAAPQPPTCNRLQLDGDGSYRWTAISDAVERDDTGPWSFRARDATSGVACLGDGSVVDFALLPSGGLRWGGLRDLVPDGPGRPGLVPVVPPPPITVDPMFVALTAHLWVNNIESEDPDPTEMMLARDGTMGLRYQSGECIGGTFSLVREPYRASTRLVLWLRTLRAGCGVSGQELPPTAHGDAPELKDGKLIFDRASFSDPKDRLTGASG